MPTPEELLEKLEERLLLGQISEAVYLDLKAKLLAKVGGARPAAAGGQSIGEGNVIKGDSRM